MNKLRFLIVLVVLLVLLNAGTLIWLLSSRNKTNGRPEPGNDASAFIIKQLQLDPQQQEQFAALRNQHQQAMRQIQEEDRELHDQYFGLLKSNDPNKSKADSISVLIGQQRTRMETATFEHFKQLRNLCRDDQQKLFDKTIDEIMRFMGPKGPPPPRR